MTIQSALLLKLGGTNQQSWGTKLDSVSTTPLEKKGAIRIDVSDDLGVRVFQYLRCDQSGGCTAGDLMAYRGVVAINNITAGTTTTITTTGLTADTLVGGFLVCRDDAGGAGAAPEGEKGRIVANTATTVTIHSSDAFSTTAALNDDFDVLLPWACVDTAGTEYSAGVAGVAMADLAQYEWGWFQCQGLHPSVTAVAAGTALPVGESLIAGAGVVTDGAGAATNRFIGVLKTGLASDTVLRKAFVDLNCGYVAKIANSTV